MASEAIHNLTRCLFYAAVVLTNLIRDHSLVNLVPVPEHTATNCQVQPAGSSIPDLSLRCQCRENRKKYQRCSHLRDKYFFVSHDLPEMRSKTIRVLSLPQ